MKNRVVVSVEIVVILMYLVSMNIVNFNDEYLVWNFVISLFLVLGKLNGVWLVLFIIEMR